MQMLSPCPRSDAHAEHFHEDFRGRSLVCQGVFVTFTYQKNYAAEDSDVVTYEAGIDEVLHPDFSIAMRLEEVALSDCENGCKIYADTRSRYRVLAHSRAYGCTVTRERVIA